MKNGFWIFERCLRGINYSGWLIDSSCHNMYLPENHSAHAVYQNRVNHTQYTSDVEYEDRRGFAFKTETDGLSTKPIEVPNGVRLHDSAKGLRMGEATFFL